MRSLLLCLLMPVFVNARAAQAQDPPRYHGIFDRVITKPTGKNGYEELALAADIASANAMLNDIQQNGTPTLSAIRKTLDQSELARVRSLIKVGLQKPVGSPREMVDDETVLPEMAGFRQLARMLSFQLYVDFADGHISHATDTLRDCLRIGYVIQTDTLISGLVGIAVDGIALRRFEEHLDQLGASDCDRLLGVVKEWLRMPDPSISVLNAERQGMATLLRKYRNNPDKLIDQLSADPQSEEYRKAESVRAVFRSNPGGAGPVLDQVGAKMSAYFDRLLVEARKAPWERQDLPLMDDGSPAGMLCGLMGDSSLGMRVMDKYAFDQAKVQMLGVWAAVRRYWWENQALPPSLDDLKLGALTTDPFTGKPFRYKALTGGSFELGSIGPLDRDRSSATAGQRQTVTFPTRK